MRDAPSMTWALVTTIPVGSTISPEPSDWARRLRGPKKRPKKGSTSRTIASAAMLTTAGRDPLDDFDDRGAAGGLLGDGDGGRGDESGEEERGQGRRTTHANGEVYGGAARRFWLGLLGGQDVVARRAVELDAGAGPDSRPRQLRRELPRRAPGGDQLAAVRLREEEQPGPRRAGEAALELAAFQAASEGGEGAEGGAAARSGGIDEPVALAPRAATSRPARPSRSPGPGGSSAPGSRPASPRPPRPRGRPASAAPRAAAS